MQWVSAAVRTPNVGDAVARAASSVLAATDGVEPDLCLFFVSHHFRDAFPHLTGLIQEHLPARVIAGCSAGGVIGGGLELENEPALSLVAARLPDVEVRIFHTDTQNLPDADAPPDLWRNWLDLRAADQKLFVVLADPFSARLDSLLTGLDYAFPSAAKIGGLASGGRNAGEHALFDGRRLYSSGVLLLAFRGNLDVDTLVAQGCRPIGKPLTVTRCENNVLLEVDGKSPLHYLAELVEKLPEEDRKLMRTSLFLGLRVDEAETPPERGEYLVRNLVGIDYARGILAVGAPLSPGQVVHFHLRDKSTSTEDLEQLLSRYRVQAGTIPPRGALLFSCVGRGLSLYGEKNHDSRLLAKHLGEVPLGGFFCNGEIGPVSHATHVHGYTSSFGFFRPAKKEIL